MKEISELSFPDDMRYTKDHEWAKKLDDGKVRVGITDYAQDQLGDIVFVEMPEVGATFLNGGRIRDPGVRQSGSPGLHPRGRGNHGREHRPRRLAPTGQSGPLW